MATESVLAVMTPTGKIADRYGSRGRKSTSMNSCFCSACGREAPNEPPELRTPCAACGSTARDFHVVVVESLEVREHMQTKHRQPGGSKFEVETTEGDDYTRRDARWDRLRRVIDRPNDRYVETVWNGDSGEVRRHVDEPLSQHRSRSTPKQ